MQYDICSATGFATTHLCLKQMIIKVNKVLEVNKEGISKIF
jgi:hypothetical protein